MRRLAIVLGLVFVFAAADAFAHCRKCQYSQGCLSCADTDNNAAVLCTIVYNGNGCYLQGDCIGPAGADCEVMCLEEDHAQLRPREMKLKGEWQLVSVEVTSPKEKQRS